MRKPTSSSNGKSSNPTSLIAPSSKNGKTREEKSWTQQYKEMEFLSHQPTPMFIERLAKELLDWSKLSDSLRLSDFHWDRFITEKNFYKWIAEYESLGMAHKIAKNAIASRREKGMLSKEMPENGVLRTLYLYDPMYAQVRQDEIDAKKEIAMVNNEAHTRPTQIILGELPGLSEYKNSIQSDKELVE